MELANATRATNADQGHRAPWAQPSRSVRRIYWLSGFAILLVLVAASYLLNEYLSDDATISTDDAYVEGSLAQVTPSVSGTVSQVSVHDTEYVNAGDVLVKLDPKDAQLNVEAARAVLEQASQHAHQNIAHVNAAEANVLERQSNLLQSRKRFERRSRAAKAGAVSSEEESDAQSAYDAAKYDLLIAEQELAAQRALADDRNIANSPEVLAAKAALDKSELDLQRTKIVAPIDGVIAQSHVQVGQQVAQGTNIMSVVPIGRLYVDANFKENQLRYIRIGQPVWLTSDLYGPDVAFHGRVQGISGGTGSAFAIIPAQNATGNWIKVIQRLPVRIALSPDELAKHPLRVGVSMTAQIEYTHISSIPAPAHARETPILRELASGSY